MKYELRHPFGELDMHAAAQGEIARLTDRFRTSPDATKILMPL